MARVSADGTEFALTLRPIAESPIWLNDRSICMSKLLIVRLTPMQKELVEEMIYHLSVMDRSDLISNLKDSNLQYEDFEIIENNWKSSKNGQLQFDKDHAQFLFDEVEQLCEHWYDPWESYQCGEYRSLMNLSAKLSRAL